jgi:hypothetical protein
MDAAAMAEVIGGGENEGGERVAEWENGGVRERQDEWSSGGSASGSVSVSEDEEEEREEEGGEEGPVRKFQAASTGTALVA